MRQLLPGNRISPLLAILLALGSAVLPAFAVDEYKAGTDLFAKRKYREAGAVFERVIQNDPTNSKAMYYSGLCYQYQGNHEAACRVFRKLMLEFPETGAGINAKKFLLSRPITQTLGSPSRGASAASSGKSTPNDPNQPDSETVPFQKEPGGHLIVTCTLNGRSQPFIFDTGAEGCVAGKNHLAALGLPLPKGEANGAAAGVGGYADVWTMPAEISLGRIRKKVDLHVQEKLNARPLLGQSFFQNYHYDIDNSSGTIRFYKPNSTAKNFVPHDTIEVPFQKDGQEIVVTAKVNGVMVPLFFDTGAQSTLFTNSINPGGDGWDLLGYGMMSGIGGSQRSLVYKVDSVELGPIRQSGMRVSVVPSLPVQYGLLGQDFFGHRKFVIDNERRVIRFFR